MFCEIEVSLILAAVIFYHLVWAGCVIWCHTSFFLTFIFLILFLSLPNLLLTCFFRLPIALSGFGLHSSSSSSSSSSPMPWFFPSVHLCDVLNLLRGSWRLSWWTTHRMKVQLVKRTTSKAKYVLSNSWKYVCTVIYLYMYIYIIHSRNSSFVVTATCGIMVVDVFNSFRLEL